MEKTFLTGVAAWVFPGGGYFVQKRWIRGAVVGHDELFGESVIELWHTVPYDDRMTVCFGVPGLHSFLEESQEGGYWRERYVHCRRQVEDIVSSGN